MQFKSKLLIILLIAMLTTIGFASASSLRSDALQAILAGQSVDLIVEYDDSSIEKVAKEMRKKTRNHIDDQKTLNYKIKEYRALKENVDKKLLPQEDIVHITSFGRLPLSVKRIKSIAAIEALISQPGVKAIYQNSKVNRMVGGQNLPLINQPKVAEVGELGQNTTIVVIDDGIDLDNTAFGDCTSPYSTSQSCKVAAAINIISNPGQDNMHGTNVAAIASMVAPGSKIAALNIFDENGYGYESDVIAAIEWAIANKIKYNIVAINMSLGDDTLNTQPCANDWSSAAIRHANDSGISVIAAAGNSGFTNGLPSPACAPGAISVGAVYDSNMGTRGFLSTPSCFDKTTEADKIACFSNSASNLTLLAPGVKINAAGITYSGTSQAAPHVAGAVAVLRSTYPEESLSQIQARMTSTGVPINDPRNNITTPRLNLLAAATPINDMFINRAQLNGIVGRTSGTTLLASKEVNEPNILGNAGGQSLWWKWTAPQSGQLSLNSNGSNFDSLLAVYTGSELSALNSIASKDNTSNQQEDLVLQVKAGTEYVVAIDVANGSPSNFAINWNLNTNPQANLTTNITGTNNVSIGSTSSYILNISNNGPQAATNVILNLKAPVDANIISTLPSCSVSNNIMSCMVGTLSNGASKSFSFQIVWNAVTSAITLEASASSDSSTNNTQTTTSVIQIATSRRSTIVEAPNIENADAPSLPEWGIVLLGLAILLINLKTSKKLTSKY